MKKIITGLIYLLSFSVNAHADQAIIGKEFVKICAVDSGKATCDTILLASIKRIEKTKIENKKIICFPDSVGTPEKLIVVKNFIRASPAYLHLNLDTLSLGALQTAFSCR